MPCTQVSGECVVVYLFVWLGGGTRHDSWQHKLAFEYLRYATASRLTALPLVDWGS